MKCPHCNKNSIHIEDWMIKNALNYGGSTFNFKCPKCNMMVGIQLTRNITIGKPFKSDAEIED